MSPEYQLIDDFGWGKLNNSELEDWQKAGADYAMYSADEKIKKLKPAGEWNSTKIKYTAEKVEHWLNGELIVSFVPYSDEWYTGEILVNGINIPITENLKKDI